ncbi:MAG: peptide chain release factor N(5)-glutamine methyltransferase [Gammaproteobacteria bacterium]|nr:MAG: peptide chain release factor N(5)-glutamine methyltransferase [Gammaproteobacteria bacterium]
MNIAELIRQASEQLAAASDSPRLDAEILLCHVLQKPRSYLLAWPEREPDAEQAAAFQSLIEQRQTGIPIAHLTGYREFWSLLFKVTPDTLIPRPETELLVEQVLDQFPGDADIALLDLGTGSGAIALAIASERPRWRIVASDTSAAALAIAQDNAQRLGIHNVEFRQGHWLDCVKAGELFDIIVSNPPYIAEQDAHLQQGDVRFDPITALSSGADGLDDIRIIVHDSREHLRPGGSLLIEHGYDQQQEIQHIFSQNGYDNILQRRDMANNPRTTCGTKPN